MPAKEMVSTALLLLGVVLGPAFFLITIVGYGISKVMSLTVEYREQRYLRSFPCGTCQYFANNEFLPCAINPSKALTEESFSCYDVSPAPAGKVTNDYNSYLRTLINPTLKLKSPQTASKHSRNIT